MPRRIWPTLAIAAFAALACKNGVRSSPAAASGGERRAVLFFTTGTLGYVEPCGCTSKPLGGIQRLASVIAGTSGPRALVDAGGLLLPKELDDTTREQHLTKAQLLAATYRQLGAIAINLGVPELGAGRDFLKTLQREGAVPLVSANVRPGTGGPSVAQSFLREVGEIAIGVTGVAAPEAFAGAEGVAAIEFAPALRAELASLEKRGAEINVVLAYLPDGAARDLARNVPGIDLLIRAPGTEITKPPSPPVRVGSTVIVEAGSQGQYLGRLGLVLDGGRPAKPLAFDDGGAGAARRDAITARKIAALEQQIAELRGDPTKLETLAAYQAQIAQLAASGRSAEDGKLSGPRIAYELVALGDAIAEHAETKGALERYYTKLAAMNAEKGDPARCAPAEGAPRYVGSDACAECHDEAYAFWKKTKHAVAWKTLVDLKKEFDLTCVACHTVGYQTPGGFCRLSDAGKLVDVGCEMCHGPGSAHAAADGDTDLIRLSTDERTCAGLCHVPEHSDQFEYGAYLERITGEGHTLTDASRPRR